MLISIFFQRQNDQFRLAAAPLFRREILFLDSDKLDPGIRDVDKRFVVIINARRHLSVFSLREIFLGLLAGLLVVGKSNETGFVLVESVSQDFDVAHGFEICPHFRFVEYDSVGVEEYLCAM